MGPDPSGTGATTASGTKSRLSTSSSEHLSPTFHANFPANFHGTSQAILTALPKTLTSSSSVKTTSSSGSGAEDANLDAGPWYPIRGKSLKRPPVMCTDEPATPHHEPSIGASRTLDLLDRLRTEYLKERGEWLDFYHHAQTNGLALERSARPSHVMTSISTSKIASHPIPQGWEEQTPLASAAHNKLDSPHSPQLQHAVTRNFRPSTETLKFKVKNNWLILPDAADQWHAESQMTVWGGNGGDQSTGVANTHHRLSVSLPRWKVDPKGIRKLITGGCVISPNNNMKLFWDVLGVVLICYDMLTIPMQAFDPPKTTFTTSMDYITLCFWTFDLALSFFTGFFEKGDLVLNHRRIVRHYLFTWFIMDCLVVVPDWFMTITVDSNTGGDVSGLGRVLRAMRAIRVLRLLRLFKLQRIIAQLQEFIDSEYAFTVVGLLKLMLFILVLNHGIACMWFLIGKSSFDNGMQSWLETSGTIDTELAYEYTTSLHWSLTQFTPASMDVSATNVWERIFSIFVLLFAIVAFSSIVASITGSMTSIRNARGEEMKQFWLLRRYLRQRSVDKDLTQRIFKYVEHQIVSQTKMVQASNISLLKKLSDPLSDELSSAINAPILAGHMFFSALAEDTPFAIHRLCRTAIKLVSVAAEDCIFNTGATAAELYFVKCGLFEYAQTKGDCKVRTDVSMNGWISEHCLWTRWSHHGIFTASSPGELLTINPGQFSSTVELHPRSWHFAKIYAELFVDALNKMEETSDIFEGVEFYADAVEVARTESSPQSLRELYNNRRDEDPFLAPPVTEASQQDLLGAAAGAQAPSAPSSPSLHAHDLAPHHVLDEHHHLFPAQDGPQISL